MATPVRVLLVEDNDTDAELLQLRLVEHGFRPTVTRVDEEPAFLAALRDEYDVILSDWRLPRFSGARALELAVQARPEWPFIIVSGALGEEVAVAALRAGARDFVMKDRPARLGAAVEAALADRRHRADRQRALERMELQTAALQAAANGIVITDTDGVIEWANAAFTELTGFAPQDAVGRNPRELLKSGTHDAAFYKTLWDTLLEGRVWRGELVNRRRDGTRYREEQTITPVRDRTGTITHFIAIKQDVTERHARQAELAALHEETRARARALEEAYETTIEGWSHALDLRDKETEGHTRRVTEVTMRLARAAGLPAEQLVQIRRGALLHDIGKMGVPDAILLKPGELTPDEWRIMRRHPEFARDLLWPIEFLRPAIDIPYCHHERWDGGGYPRGLAGEDIPLSARLFAVVDIWDALRSARPYRPAWPEAQVQAHLRSLAGTHLDPGAVEAFFAAAAAEPFPPPPPPPEPLADAPPGAP